ncbi:MAG TPA: FAD-dependent oxidoreductase, partial [Oligoflexia bacterium]|nr:FAD-dependent oxidoreductase [Oligoflexia bacterium]
MERSDFLVIGSGLAGLIFALDVADAGTVTVLTKSDPFEGSTRYAQGGIASVMDARDSFDAHVRDTHEAGAGLCHQDTVELAVREGPDAIAHLTRLGVAFDREGSGTYSLGREGGHSARRILHAADATGAEIQRVLLENALAHPNIRILADHIAVDLITSLTTHGEKEVVGAYALDRQTDMITSFAARATMLATGGVGKVYLYTSNPDIATGDGIAIAYRAGARVANMEFIQFHPTCLYHPKAKSFLITEAMRGEGACLRLPTGERFMPHYHQLAELAPRDIVARAIDDQMKKTGCDYVLLDITHRSADFIQSRFPMIYEKVKEFGCDITKEPIPVVPAAHYCCGGVVSDLDGRTGLPRLYTAGET